MKNFRSTFLVLALFLGFAVFLRVITQVSTPQNVDATSPGGSSFTVSQWPPKPKSGEPPPPAADLAVKNVYVVFDASGSMDDVSCSGSGLRKLDEARAALTEFLKSVKPNVNLGLLIFDGYGPSERVELGLDNRARFLDQVKSTVAGGGTPLLQAMAMAFESLGVQAQKQLGYGEYNLIVVTDGEASNGQNPEPVVSELASKTPVAIHTIGFCLDGSHSLNQPGKTSYRSADNVEKLRAGLEEVLAEAASFDVKSF